MDGSLADNLISPPKTCHRIGGGGRSSPTTGRLVPNFSEGGGALKNVGESGSNYVSFFLDVFLLCTPFILPDEANKILEGKGK